MLVAAYILATIEKGLRKIIPTVLDNLLTPLLAILSTAFLTFLFVGPITEQLGYWLSDGLTWLYMNLEVQLVDLSLDYFMLQL